MRRALRRIIDKITQCQMYYYAINTEYVIQLRITYLYHTLALFDEITRSATFNI